MRKIIQIEVLPEGECTSPGIFALCDDGKLFRCNIRQQEWVEMKQIPQNGDKNESNA